MYKMLMLSFSITFLLLADFEKNPLRIPEGEVVQQETASMPDLSDEEVPRESSNADELLELVKDEDISAPDIKPPSRLMVLLRTFGIAVISKYYAIKGWVVKKWSSEAST